MDKNEYNQKLDEINVLVAQEDFEGAAKIADTIEWKRVRNSGTLCMISEIYEANGRLEDGKDILLRAYQRSQIGRTILFRLAEVAIKLKEYDEAVEYYSEFVNAAPHDTSRYILKYKIYKGRGSSLADQISILEEYKEKEYTEKWSYELAVLYRKEGNIQKCIEECDDLVLWFRQGKYVIKALELKKSLTTLTPIQQAIYNHKDEMIHEKVDKVEAIIPAMEKVITDKLPSSHEEVVTDSIITEAQKELAQAVTQHTEETQEPVEKDWGFDAKAFTTDTKIIPDLNDELDKRRKTNSPEAQQTEIPPTFFNAENLQQSLAESMHAIVSGLSRKDQEVDVIKPMNHQAYLDDADEDYEEIDAHGQKKETIDDILTSMAGVPQDVPQDEMDVAKDCSGISLTDKPDSEKMDISEEKQRLGKSAISDEKQQPEKMTIPEEKQEPEKMTVPEEKQEPEKMTVPEEKQEPEKMTVPEEQQEPEKMTVPEEKQEPEKMTVPEEQQEPEKMKVPQEQQEPEKMMVPEERQEPKEETEPDKVSLPEKTQKSEKIVRPEAVQEKVVISEGNQDSKTNSLSEESYQSIDVSETDRSQELKEFAEIAKDSIRETISESVKSLTKEIISPEEKLLIKGELRLREMQEQEQEAKQQEALEPMPIKDITMDLSVVVEAAAGVSHLKPKTKGEEAKEKDTKDTKEYKQKPKPQLTKDQQSIFSYFARIQGLSDDIAVALDEASNKMRKDKTSKGGNIVITGLPGSGRTTLGIYFAKALSLNRGKQAARVAKIYAEDLNEKDIAATVAKIAGGTLIIEEAGDLKDNVVQQLSKAMDFRTDGLIIILEDEKRLLKPLFERNGNFAEKFTSEINIPIFTNDELVIFGKTYADHEDYVIDKMAETVLYNRIGALQSPDHPVTIIDVKEILDKAIRHSERMSLRKVKNILTRKRYDHEDRIILYEKDFK